MSQIYRSDQFDRDFHETSNRAFFTPIFQKRSPPIPVEFDYQFPRHGARCIPRGLFTRLKVAGRRKKKKKLRPIRGCYSLVLPLISRLRFLRTLENDIYFRTSLPSPPPPLHLHSITCFIVGREGSFGSIARNFPRKLDGNSASERGL